MKRSSFGVMTGAAALSFGAGSLPGRAANGPDSVSVGAALPLTGDESRIGGYFKAAYELYVKELNDNGGLMLSAYRRKVPIKLTIYDDKTDPATSRNLYERLAVQDNVDAMLGGYATDLVQAQTVVPQQHQIPYVNGGGAATEIYKRGFTTIFGLLSSIQNLAFSECDFIELMQAQRK
ncbi:MAG TPA: ABC transporter substrate-binding protein, partial [Candidatus Baltobacteraceae bacterium]|nr:ABC transporter substrate-binding protein [Candidatus Baltobacteraceae bacterium]